RFSRDWSSDVCSSDLRLAAGEPAELTSGTQVRDYLDVRAAGERIAAAALGMGEGATNICSGEGVTVGALAESIADEYGRRDLLQIGRASCRERGETSV